MTAQAYMSAERYARIRQLLALRQPDLTVCLEQVHKPFNVSAIVRSCDAVGVQRMHAVWEQRAEMRKGTAMGSENWVYIQEHKTTKGAIETFKQQNMQVLVTHLSDAAVDFREVDYTLPTAIILGQEKHGATREAVAMADQQIVIPMVGMVQSLNVSVAGALILYEAQRQRQLAGMYDSQRVSEADCQKMLFEGGFPIFREMCDRKGIAYPHIDDQGHIQADSDWWQQMQTNQTTK